MEKNTCKICGGIIIFSTSNSQLEDEICEDCKKVMRAKTREWQKEEEAKVEKINKLKYEKEIKLNKENENKHARDFGKKFCVVLDWFEDGIRRLVLNIGGKHFTQYLGIPEDHPLAGFDYDDIPLYCHGGLTFSGKGDGKMYPRGYWWYGWDYAHSGDYIPFGILEIDEKSKKLNKDWTLEEVIEDGREACYYFKKLMNITEEIAKKRSKKINKTNK